MLVSDLFLTAAMIVGVSAFGLVLRFRRRRAERLKARRVRREEMDQRWREVMERNASNRGSPD